jgi:hypothetical protein
MCYTLVYTLNLRHDHIEEGPSHPCSDTNHLVLAAWEGEDKHNALENRISDSFDVMSESINSEILLGGDTSFLCANFGCHSAMEQPCPICPHAFDKTSHRDSDTIPFTPSAPKAKNKRRVKRTPYLAS